MTLRARLTLSLAALLALVVLALGAVAVRSTQRVLVDQIDEGLVEIVNRPGFDGALTPDVGRRLPLRQTYAIVVVGADGDVVAEVPAGFDSDPLPLPDVTDVTRPIGRGGELATIPARDGDIPYRAIVVAGPRETTIVIGHPLDGVATTVARLQRATILGGVLVLAAGAALTWWTVRRETRSIDEMVEVAGSVAHGDLGRRLEGRPAAAELADLQSALNDMFDRNESAFERERATTTRLRQFVADASHELRTPLTAISGYAQLHRIGGLEDPDTRATAMARIESETARMERLVADLLLLARTDESAGMAIGPVHLDPVISAAVTDHAARAPGHPVVVGDVDHIVLAGPDLLTQIVANLLANVAHHTPAGTTATISASRKGDRVDITVSDDGPGVPPDALPYLFDRFFRAGDPMRRSGPGSGLGLSIVAGLVGSVGGEVSAATGPSGGLAITVRLQAAENGPANHGAP